MALATQRELCEEDAGSEARWGPEPRGPEAAARPLGGQPVRVCRFVYKWRLHLEEENESNRFKEVQCALETPRCLPSF